MALHQYKVLLTSNYSFTPHTLDGALSKVILACQSAAPLRLRNQAFLTRVAPAGNTRIRVNLPPKHE